MSMSLWVRLKDAELVPELKLSKNVFSSCKVAYTMNKGKQNCDHISQYEALFYRCVSPLHLLKATPKFCFL